MYKKCIVVLIITALFYIYTTTLKLILHQYKLISFSKKKEAIQPNTLHLTCIHVHIFSHWNSGTYKHVTLIGLHLNIRSLLAPPEKWVYSYLPWLLHSGRNPSLCRLAGERGGAAHHKARGAQRGKPQPGWQGSSDLHLLSNRCKFDEPTVVQIGAA